MATFSTLRRYYLLKRLSAKTAEDHAISAVWQSKQEGEPGVALPADFPARAKLVAAGYTTDADLDGSDAAELIDYAQLTQREADAVIAAAAAL